MITSLELAGIDAVEPLVSRAGVYNAIRLLEVYHEGVIPLEFVENEIRSRHEVANPGEAVLSVTVGDAVVTVHFCLRQHLQDVMQQLANMHNPNLNIVEVIENFGGVQRSYLGLLRPNGIIEPWPRISL